MLCEEGPERILEMEQWGTRWARENGHVKQEMAPGHSRRRCCYVDFLNTGPAVAATLRRKVGEISEVRRISNVAVGRDSHQGWTCHRRCRAQLE